MKAFKAGPGNTVTLSQNKHRRHSTSRGRMQAMKEAEAGIRSCKSRNAKNFQATPEARKRLQGTSLQVSEGHDPVDTSDFIF